jgi:type II secretory ATPase GspE/PulE/Tfp pilus assembly ATPase PilB-like protein
MAVAAQVAGAPSRTGAPSPAEPEFPARLWAAIERAAERPTGLVTVTGPGAEKTAAALHRRFGLPLIGLLSDGPAVNAAVDAAERGLALATLDCGDAVSAILALRRLAGDRFAFAAALRLVIAQRVAPGLCGACRRPVQAFGSTAALLGMDPGAILWSAPGCEGCGGSGQGPEIGVFEGVEVDAPMRRLIYDGADAPLLARHAFLAAPNLASAARTLAREGILAAEEAVRVSRS